MHTEAPPPPSQIRGEQRKITRNRLPAFLHHSHAPDRSLPWSRCFFFTIYSSNLPFCSLQTCSKWRPRRRKSVRPELATNPACPAYSVRPLRRHETPTTQSADADADYTLNNPDTLTKYKTAAQISEKVLAEVSKLCVAGEKIITICEKGDKLIEEEITKVYRGKKINKGM